MNEKYLVINCGSSSLKFQLFGMPQQEVIAKGTVERIGTEKSSWKIEGANEKIVNSKPLANHVETVKVVLEELLQNGLLKDINEIKGIGHRILHGGTKYKDSAIITDEVIEDIKDKVELGPLHIPGQLAGIDCMTKIFENVPQVAVFDTSFHQTIPKKNYQFAISKKLKDAALRGYGFHGISVKYIVEYMQKVLGKKDINVVVCHIGSGASVTAVKYGKSYNTSMSFTPNAGVIMGTRCGDIDISIIPYLCRKTGKSIEEVISLLNNESGLYGLTGMNDYRDIEKAAKDGDEDSIAALEMHTASVVKFISRYITELGHVDAIVFTAGIGENSSSFRKSVCSELSLDSPIVALDEDANNSIAGFKEKHEGLISNKKSKIPVYVVPTDEEKMIMLDTYRLVKGIEKEKDDFVSFEELDKKYKEAREQDGLGLMLFYVSHHYELYQQIQLEKDNQEYSNFEEIFSEMLNRNNELHEDFYQDYSDLGYLSLGEIIEARLNEYKEENKQKTYTR